MQKLYYSVEISAPKEKIWDVLWNRATYKKWAYVIDPEQYLENDWHTWEKGSKLRFMHPSGYGVAAVIEEYQPYQKISYKVTSDIIEGKEQAFSDESKAWANAVEVYTLEPRQNHVLLSGAFDVPDAHKDELMTSYPKALQIVKELAEA
jgi:uncharacterized protein YndB with AHSA1/START domain